VFFRILKEKAEKNNIGGIIPQGRSGVFFFHLKRSMVAILAVTGSERF